MLCGTAFLGFTNISALADLNLGLDQEFSGGTAPVSNACPWVNALFHDNGNGTVNLTLSNPHLSNNENVSGFYFNFNDALNVANLSFSPTSSSGSFTAPTISKGENSFKADGDGDYDVLFTFATGGNASQVFGVGDQVTYTISYSSAIGSSDFAFLSAPEGGNGPFYAAAHVQNTGINGSGGGWIAPTAIPEPTTVLVIPLVACACRLLRRNRSIS
jgi:hypothetical protein